MGLDTVEIVLEMEETFGIVIDDLDAEHIGTVGQAYRYILSKLELRQSGPCPSAALFYRLRRGLMARSGADRQSFCPASRIEEFLPQDGRREAWLGLRDELGMDMPGLELGHRLALAVWLIVLTPVAGLVTVWGTLGEFSAGSAVPVFLTSLVLSFLSLLVALRILDPFATKIPRGCETVRGTIEAILGRHRLAREGAARTWHREEVWITLRKLVSEQAGVLQEVVTEETSFINDLGMD